MIKRKLLQLIACGIASLSIACTPYPGNDQYLQEDSGFYSIDDEDIPDSCRGYIYITSYIVDFDNDPDGRYSIPVVRLSQYALDHPTDSTINMVGRCLCDTMWSMELQWLFFDGKEFTIDMAIELAKF